MLQKQEEFDKRAIEMKKQREIFNTPLSALDQNFGGLVNALGMIIGMGNAGVGNSNGR